MENKIQLFEDYLFDILTPAEKLAFEDRLKSDKSFALDFRIFLITVKGICKEAEEENIEFAYAMKYISEAQLCDIIGLDNHSKLLKRRIFFERMAWAVSIILILAIGIMTLFEVKRAGQYAIDDTLVAYNHIPTSSRDGSESIDITTLSNVQLEAIIPQLQKAYDSTAIGDIQEGETAGMQLALAYLKLHDRKQAKALLKELATRYAEDEAFSAQCNLILRQLE